MWGRESSSSSLLFSESLRIMSLLYRGHKACACVCLCEWVSVSPWVWGHRRPFYLHHSFFSIMSFCCPQHFLFCDDLVDAFCALILNQFRFLIQPKITTRKKSDKKSVDKMDPFLLWEKTNTFLFKVQLHWTSRSMTHGQHCHNKQQLIFHF